MKKLYIIHNDLDGIANYVLLKYYNINYDNIISMGYEEYDVYKSEIRKYSEDDFIIFIDFSPNKEYMKIIEENKITCIVYDHHSSAFNLLHIWKYNKFTYYYDEDLSGTAIFYKNDSNFEKKVEIIQEFVDLVSIYDTNKKKNLLYGKAQNLNRLFYKFIRYGVKDFEKYEVFLKAMFYKFTNLQKFVFNKLEETKIQEDKQREKKIFLDLINGGTKTIKTRKDREGNYFCVIRLSSKISNICNMLLEKYTRVQYVICINEYKPNLTLSLRSREGFSLLDFNNIEGHPSSAGYVNVTNEICENLWKGSLFCLTKSKK